MVELFNNTTIEEWPTLISRPSFNQQYSTNEAAYRHFETENEVKIEADEQSQHIKMESPRIHSSFSSMGKSTNFETPQSTHKVTAPVGLIDSHERR